MIGGTALRQTGHDLEAHRAFSESFSHAKDAEMSSAAAHSATNIAALMTQQGNQSGAHSWLAAAETIGSTASDSTAQSNILGLRLRIGLQECHYEGLEYMAFQYSAGATTLRLKCLSELVNARLAMHLRGEPPSDAVMSQLSSIHQKLAASFSSDLSAVALLDGYTMRHERSSGEQFLRHYLHHERRSRDTVAFELRNPWPGVGR
jgi:hypothetical protein